MEIWQIAALMTDEETGAPSSNRPGQPFTSRPTTAGENLIAARVAAARAGEEIDSREMVEPISEDSMTAFLEQRIAQG